MEGGGACFDVGGVCAVLKRIAGLTPLGSRLTTCTYDDWRLWGLMLLSLLVITNLVFGRHQSINRGIICAVTSWRHLRGHCSRQGRVMTLCR